MLVNLVRPVTRVPVSVSPQRATVVTRVTEARLAQWVAQDQSANPENAVHLAPTVLLVSRYHCNPSTH